MVAPPKFKKPPRQTKFDSAIYRDKGVIDLRGHGLVAQPPKDLDPNKFYLDNYRVAVAKAQGVERLVYAYIPYSVIKSFALAFDPLRKFKAVSGKVTPTNRTRVRTLDSVLSLRTYQRTVKGDVYASEPNYQGHLGLHGPLTHVSSYGGTDTFPFSRQGPTITTTADTTKRTRPVNSEYGEFEHFQTQMFSPSRLVRSDVFNDVSVELGGGNVARDRDVKTTTSQIIGPSALLTQFSLNNLKIGEAAYASALMSKEAAGMLKDILPTNRKYSIFREIVELRDFPRTILQFRNTAQNLTRLLDGLARDTTGLSKILSYSRTSLKDIPKEYLSYHFGYRQMFSAIMDLVDKPLQIAKEVNYLQKRSGQPTTFRRTKKFLTSPTTSPPTFEYDSLSPEEYSRVQSNGLFTRETELKMVINTTFDFPPLEIPKFKRQLFLKKLGAHASITDLYNLTPWTWLLDWFSGIGNYVQAMDTINNDPSLINWGFITSIQKGKCSTMYSSKSDSFSDVRTNGHLVSQTFTKVNLHTSTVEWTYHLRKELGLTYGVKSLQNTASLTTYQKSILGAILTSRTPHKTGPR